MKNRSPTTMISGKTNRIVFFGTEEFSAASLLSLIKAGFNIVAVVTKPDSRKGRGQQLVPPTVKKIAESHQIPVWQPQKLSEITPQIVALQPVAGVLVSFGKIIPQSIIELFRPGIINVHPSKLPMYRGPSPVESAILNGDSETGVSIMQLSAAMDAGPVYSFIPHALSGSETQPELYETLSELGASELVRSLPQILDGSLQPAPQDDTQASYCQLIQKADSIIDWTKPAIQIEREIRAYASWPGSRTTIGSIEVIITAASVGRTASDSEEAPGSFKIIDEERDIAAIYAGDGHLLIESLKPVGKKEMPMRAFLAGYKDRLQAT